MLYRIRILIRNNWQDIIDGFWFVPGLVSLLGLVLAFILLMLDQVLVLPPVLLDIEGDPETVRSMLSTIAGSVIAVAALVFSLTLVAVQLVSAQFTSRALRSLLSDRITQIAAGGLIGIFLYCQIVLLNIRNGEQNAGYIPVLSTLIGFVLAFVGIGLLLIFINNIVNSIQVANITARIARQTYFSMKKAYPGWQESLEKEQVEQQLQVWYAEQEPVRIRAGETGYVQVVLLKPLAKLVMKHGIKMYVRVRPGEFVTHQTVIAEVWAGSVTDKRLFAHMQDCIAIARERDLEQDALFGVRQIADISLRALSPAINDPTTGVLCIGYLQSLIEHLASMPDQSAFLKDRNGPVIMVANTRAFGEYAKVLVEIGRYASTNARVVLALLQALVGIAEAAKAYPERILLLKSMAVVICEKALNDEENTEFDKNMITQYRRRMEQYADKVMQPVE